MKSTKKQGSSSLNPIVNIYFLIRIGREYLLIINLEYCSNYCIIKLSVTKDLLLTVQLQVLISALGELWMAAWTLKMVFSICVSITVYLQCSKHMSRGQKALIFNMEVLTRSCHIPTAPILFIFNSIGFFSYQHTKCHFGCLKLNSHLRQGDYTLCAMGNLLYIKIMHTWAGHSWLLSPNKLLNKTY